MHSSAHRLPFVRRLLETAVSALAPDVCAACDARVAVMTVFCPPCAATLVPAATGDPDHLAPFAYGGALATAIGSFKYDKRPDRARPLAHLLLAAMGPLRDAPLDLVVPVPLHPHRLDERGFNQSVLLARPVARALGARLAIVLERRRETEAQATLDRAIRRRNVEGAFLATKALAGERVLLVDDVRTTGATIAACAEALCAAGAGRVQSLVLAQTEL